MIATLRCMRNTMTVVTVFVAALGLCQSAFAGAEIDTDGNGVALKGHDPVAYFTDGTPVQGSADYAAKHNDATYHFASAENRDTFLADPDKYAPQYGGYCAFGTTFGKKVPGDPQAWKIEDGKLYINSSPDVLTRWSADVPGNIEKADGIWSEIKSAAPEDL